MWGDDIPERSPEPPDDVIPFADDDYLEVDNWDDEEEADEGDEYEWHDQHD